MKYTPLFKSWKIIFLVAALIITSFSFKVVAEDKEALTLEMSYCFNEPVLSNYRSKDHTYDTVTLPDCYCSGNPGEPNIPSKGAYILLPPNSKLSSIQVIGKNKIAIGSNYKIMPISQPIPISKNTPSVKIKEDKNIYGNNNFYPGNTYSHVEIYSFKGYDILVLLLHPMQYNPVSGELFYYENLDLKIKTSYHEKESLYRGLEQDKIEVINKVDNPEIADLYTLNIDSKTQFLESYDLLILTTDSLKSGFEPLKNAHGAQGHKTVIKTLSDVGSDNPDEIREYIKDAYFNWGINYVLLGGDMDNLPAKIFWVFGLDENTTPYETEMPSDLYYSCLDGPFNYDGDEKWAEPTDGEDGGDVDLYAEVHVGRACVDDLNDVNNFVTKTLAYINKDPDSEYLKNVLFAGEYMGDHGIATWGGNYLDQMIDICTDDGYETTGFPSEEYTINKLYDRDWEENDWPPEVLVEEIDNGLHIINHLGHSSYEYCMKMYYEYIYDFSNTDYCFIYSQGCMAGGFDCDYCDCIAEHLTVKTDTGAFAGIFNARYGWFWSESTDGDSQRFHREFWDAVFKENIPEIGRANSDSKEDNLAIISRSCIRWCYYQLNLFGDPSLQISEFENNPPETPIIKGEREGNVTERYEFSFTINDPDNDKLYLRIDWDDNTTSNWTGLYDSGSTLKFKYSWDIVGEYTVRARVKDTYGLESDWGTLEINIPRVKKSSNMFFQRFIDKLPNIAPLLRYLLRVFS
jgi:hypothetical protein